MLPESLKEEILKRVSNKELAKECLKYLKVEEKNGKKYIVENFKDFKNHKLLFTLLECIKVGNQILNENG